MMSRDWLFTIARPGGASRGISGIHSDNKARSGIRTVKIGQSDLINRTLRFCQRDLHKTYSINFHAL
jgi:hypothetical protein